MRYAAPVLLFALVAWACLVPGAPMPQEIAWTPCGIGMENEDSLRMVARNAHVDQLVARGLSRGAALVVVTAPLLPFDLQREPVKVRLRRPYEFLTWTFALDWITEQHPAARRYRPRG